VLVPVHELTVADATALLDEFARHDVDVLAARSDDPLHSDDDEDSRC
jgi:hypothetical protein